MSLVGTATSTEIPKQNDEILVDDLFNSYDWSSSPLGPMHTWEPILKSAVVIFYFLNYFMFYFI
jgi:hypothetical protein